MKGERGNCEKLATDGTEQMVIALIVTPSSANPFTGVRCEILKSLDNIGIELIGLSIVREGQTSQQKPNLA